MSYRDFELKHFADGISSNVGRCGLGDRQEGIGKLALRLLPLIERINSFTHLGLSKEPNILRDSCELRLQALPCLADIHVNAIYYFQVLEEFRALSNTKDPEGRTLSPLGGADLSDQLFRLGETL